MQTKKLDAGKIWGALRRSQDMSVAAMTNGVAAKIKTEDERTLTAHAEAMKLAVSSRGARELSSGCDSCEWPDAQWGSALPMLVQAEAMHVAIRGDSTCVRVPSCHRKDSAEARGHVTLPMLVCPEAMQLAIFRYSACVLEARRHCGHLGQS